MKCPSMKWTTGLAIAWTVTACSTVSPVAVPPQGGGDVASNTISVFVGVRELESDNDPADEHTPIGAEYSSVLASGWGWAVGSWINNSS